MRSVRRLSAVLSIALRKRFDARVALSPGFRWGGTILPGQEHTLEDVYAHTALTYPNTRVHTLTGRDPYSRRGGDVLRRGGSPTRSTPPRAMEAAGPPAWDVVADHPRRLERVKLDPRPHVRVV